MAQIRTYKDAVAVVTGGASGIGRALSEALVAQGATVLLVDLQEELADKVAVQLRSTGARAFARKMDVASLDQFRELAQDVRNEYNRIDYLFNNAGMGYAGPLHFHNTEQLHRIVNVNLFGVINGIQAFYGMMIEQGFGHIVNTASMAGLIPMALLAPYSATKHAVVALSNSLRVEARHKGIYVSVLCPGVIETPILDSGGAFGKMLFDTPRELMDKLKRQTYPMEPTAFAKQALRALTWRSPIIIRPWWWRLLWYLYRFSPPLYILLNRLHYSYARWQIKKHVQVEL